MVYQCLPSLLYLTLFTPFLFLKVISFSFNPLPLTEPNATCFLPVSSRAGNWAEYSASSKCVFKAQSTSQLTFLHTLFSWENWYFLSWSLKSASPMNFKSVTLHSTLYSRHFKTSSLTWPVLSSELNAASVTNRFPLQLLNFYWSITIFAISKPKIQSYFIFRIISIYHQSLKKYPSKLSCNTGDHQNSDLCNPAFRVGTTCLPILCHFSPILLYSGKRLIFLK